MVGRGIWCSLGLLGEGILLSHGVRGNGTDLGDVSRSFLSFCLAGVLGREVRAPSEGNLIGGGTIPGAGFCRCYCFAGLIVGNLPAWLMVEEVVVRGFGGLGY